MHALIRALFMLKVLSVLGCLLLINLPPAFARQNDSASWQPASLFTKKLNLNGKWRIADENGDLGETNVPGALSNDGRVSLSKKFFLPDSLKGAGVRLHALGINYNCLIEVNGSFVAGHSGGHTSFSVDLDPDILVYNAQNTITIQVDNELSPTSTLPLKHRPMGWPDRFGVLWDIYLEAIPVVLVDDFTLRADGASGDFLIDVQIRVLHESAGSTLQDRSLTLQAELRDESQGKTLVRSQPADVTVKWTSKNRVTLPPMNLDPKIQWSPDDPRLLTLNLFLRDGESVLYQKSAEVGLRDVAVSGKQFKLNGQPFTVRGVDLMESFDGLSGAELDSSIANTVKLIVGLGVNAVRIVGHAAHPKFLQACARSGLFVLEETPVYFAPAGQLAAPDFKQKVIRSLEEMIQRDKNNPAVFAWGIGTNLQNEAIETIEFLKELTLHAKNLDDRPVYAVTRDASGSLNDLSIGVDFFLFDNFGQSELLYDPTAFNKPVLPVTGFFAESPVLRKSVNDPLRSKIEAEELQASRLERSLKTFSADREAYAGSFIHTLKDWRPPSPIGTLGSDRDMGLAPAGLIREDGSLRIGYRIVAAEYLGERKPPISPDEIPAAQTMLFTFSGVTVILIFLFFLNRDKKLRSQLRRAFLHSHGFYADIFENRKVPAFATIVLGLLQGAIWGILISSVLFTWKESLLFDEITSLILTNAQVKSGLVWLVWRPGWLIASIATAYFLFLAFMALFFRILSMFFRGVTTFKQHFTLVFWTAICYLPLAIVTPVAYRFLNDNSFVFLLSAFVAGFVVWHYLRQQRGVRVLYILSPIKSVLLFLSLAALVVVGGLYSLDRSHAIFDYFSYYWALVR